jgi:hypothetical protein
MKIYVYINFLWVTVLLTSCSFPHYYYSPNVQNIPLFTEKYAFSCDFAGSVGSVNSSLEIQAGLSLPGHIALTTNLMTGGTKHFRDNVSDISKVGYFEGAAGYYTSFSDKGVFEVYGGYGKGSQHHSFAYDEYGGQLIWTWVKDGTADLSFSKIFIQPEIGFKFDWFEGAFSCRLARLNFINIDVNNTVYRLEELNSLKKITDPWLLEPAFTLRGGSKSVKFQVQINNSRCFSNDYNLFEVLRISGGLHFNLAGIQSKNFNSQNAK